MTISAQVTAPAGEALSEETVRNTLAQGLGNTYDGAKVLVLIPDHTRTLPLPMLFRAMVNTLGASKQLDFMVALGTHPPLDADALLRLVGLSAEEKTSTYNPIGLLNHAWEHPDTLAEIGTLSREQVQGLAGDNWHDSMGGDVPIRINKAVLDYDHVIILGPTFPHEVVGFSGGAKYLFPGISGPEMINTTHWLGALMAVLNIIGVKETPVRDMIHAAAACVPTPITLIALVVVKDDLAGMFIGDHLEAWRAAADLSSQRHIIWLDEPVQRVLSWAPPMYDELWSGAMAMYKLDPSIADGGVVIVYAPHLDVVSHVHGKYIYEIGYHTLPYFLNQWEKFRHIPSGVLAHSTHLRGSGTWANGAERPRIEVTLASKISRKETEALALRYMDPASIDPEAWRDRDDVLFVPKAGEMLYRVKPR